MTIGSPPPGRRRLRVHPRGEGLGLAGAPSARHVLGFTEKPDALTAKRYLATGEYRWNAGMVHHALVRPLAHLAEQRPALHDGLRTIAAAWDTPSVMPS